MKFEMGELRSYAALDLQRNIERVIEQHQKGPNYWILVYADLIGETQIVTKIMRLTQKPPKMIGTICYRVDNRKGQMWREWLLPLDIPRDDEVISLEEGLEEIAKFAQNVPIVY